MPTPLKLDKSPSLEYLRNHSSTNIQIKTVKQFFSYLKYYILSSFNSDHQFAYLGNKSVADFNLEHIKKDLNTFLKNPNLNCSEQKDKADYLTYTFEYLPIQAHILPNFYDLYHSGKIEPNALITQLINYANKLKLDKENLNTKELQQYQLIKEILAEVQPYLDVKQPQSDSLKEMIKTITNQPL
ncbi:hypothetical protein I4632_12445 [Proteus mirabilis]|uniref:hypothetical protein n=1 Tax=Proteus TaxID=583 RepID=UPI0018C72399|nr:hypothetical protein [Proteus vulgaris]MBG3081009.1 hypothetical protein [Proteus mirabilis]QPN90790.1 hypothetical protein IM703_05995 [Proteus vulgaris]